MKRVTDFLLGLLLVIWFTILERSLNKELNKEKPMTSKTALRHMAFALGILLALVATCTGAVLKAQEVPIFYAALEPHIRGQVVCNKKDEVAILLNSNFDTADTTNLRRVIEHEMYHIGQIRLLGGCIKAGEVYAKDPMAQELPAYCKELKERMLEGEAGEVLQRFTIHMHQIYGRGRSIDYVMDRTNVVCLGGSNDSS